LKEGKMSKQMELFETAENVWVKSVWKSVGLESRHEVIRVLAQMGKALLEAERAQKGRLCTFRDVHKKLNNLTDMQ